MPVDGRDRFSVKWSSKFIAILLRLTESGHQQFAANIVLFAFDCHGFEQSHKGPLIHLEASEKAWPPKAMRILSFLLLQNKFGKINCRNWIILLAQR